MKEFGPINPQFPHFLHGGDYNPDQWIKTPEIWDEDMRLMKLANCNAMSIGIFSWATLEPEEGRFDFSFLDRVMDLLAENGAKAVLATPSGARPAWLSQKYPEVLRVSEARLRNLHGLRHNHCMTSPVYREKTQTINRLLAERYRNHPALLVWHVSNEYGGECHCELCQQAFREWLKQKYGTLDRLNDEWWTRFWSHTFTSWEQIESPSSRGECRLNGLALDWKRFTTYQTVDFMKNEIVPLRELTPDIPITTNFMGTYEGLDYHKFSSVIDVASWDSYPLWHHPAGNDKIAMETAFAHDLTRMVKDGKPFMLMESTPSVTNWGVMKLKRPGMHLLSSLQAVAHGADTVQYFQWRKSRGSCEQYHGAVVDHAGHEHTRVFREVTELGKILKQLDGLIGTGVRSEAAIVFDQENRWAFEGAQGLTGIKKQYEQTVKSHYFSFWKNGLNVDVIDSEQKFTPYKIVCIPVLYMLKPGVSEKIRDYVAAGGTAVATYCTGMVNENCLTYLGGLPAGELKDVFGIWAEEIDVPYEEEINYVAAESEELSGKWRVRGICELIHAVTAKTLAVYERDFYAGRPAVTMNRYGKGKAFYIAFRGEQEFLDVFYSGLFEKLGLRNPLGTALPEGVSVHTRENKDETYLFVENYNSTPAVLELPSGFELVHQRQIEGKTELEPYGIRILRRTQKN